MRCWFTDVVICSTYFVIPVFRVFKKKKTVGLVSLHGCRGRKRRCLQTLSRASFACARPLRTAAIRPGTLLTRGRVFLLPWLKHWTEQNLSIHTCWHHDVKCSSDLQLRYCPHVLCSPHLCRTRISYRGRSAWRQAREGRAGGRNRGGPDGCASR